MSWTRRYDEPEPQRVNRWLAQSGVCSRREADALIAEGLVSIDGERVDDAGRKIAPGQTLTLSDRAAAGLEARFALLRQHPFAGPPRPEYEIGIRSLAHPPHRILYPVDGDAMLIVRIIHQARDVRRASWPHP